ncbi:MAG: 2-dehydropantoate 2-reductase [Kofleriaceae bacterium]
MTVIGSEVRRVAVVGAGGVGGLLAAMIARAGHDVRVLARGAALQAIRERGIMVRGPDGEHTVSVTQVADDAAAIGAVEVVLVTVKTWQLAELGPRVVPLIGPRTLVIPLQNGVEASELLAAALGDDHVLGAVCRVISWIERPGEVRWIGMRPSLTIGARPPSPESPAALTAIEACAALLRTGDIEVIVSDAIERARWLKFLFIVAYSAVGAVARVPLGALRADPTVRARLEAVMREVAALAEARGVALPADTVAITMQRIDVLPADATASMHRDVVDGRPSELHELIGAVVRLGRASHVATPVSAALYAELEPLERLARAR